MVQGGMKCVKYLLFAFNLVFFLAGLALIIAGALVQTKFKTYFDFFGASFNSAAILLIVIGGVIFIIGFFGCCGAYKENYCMTMTFAVLLGLIFILEIAAGIAAYVMREKVRGLVTENLTNSVGNYGGDGNDGVTRAWDILQHDFECCGVQNYTNWRNNDVLQRNNSLPDSCCRTETHGCGYQQATNPSPDMFYSNKGCVQGFVSWVKDNIVIVGGVGIGLAFVQVIGIIVACCLASAIRKEYEVV